ncbi:FAD-binding oxidoreductase [Sphingomonas aracearum]|uniref:FAD-binding oxidoreductase n=1 Tax=Sphingomonas aracearum TaxID=2283317 RepID=A0A369VYK4_9SPHN|nr:FAD-binding oxidoreductase [Sphingomonas aracearum]RDE07486.1 FAD-binding oxidoreductase [Sphingomonas aracearum]
MTPAQSRLVAAARDAFGPRAAVTDPDLIEPWLHDWRGRFHGAAPAILQPASTAEVSRLVALAREEGVALVPQGGNSSMVGGATPPSDGSALILSLRRMNGVRAISAADNLAVAEAGVILSDLHEAAATVGRRFPLTLGARGTATIGGLCSTNAGGTQVLRFGTMRSLVAGVEAVLPNGAVHDGLAALKKDNRGYDLDQLLIGAEGTLGIITAASLRLFPAIAARAVGWLGLDSPEQALRVLRRLEADTEAIESFEILPAGSLAAALAYLPDARAPLAGQHRWHVLVEAVSTTAQGEGPSALLERLLESMLAEGLIKDAAIAASEAQAEALWQLRDALSAAERAQGPAAQHDISVPVAAMPRFMLEAAAACEARFPGTHASGFGHLGDGNIHFHVRAAPGMSAGQWYRELAPEVSRFVHDLVVAAGGSISAEHGIGQMKRAELERLAAPGDLAALRAIKAAFDPHELLNPGKLVTLAPAGATI